MLCLSDHQTMAFKDQSKIPKATFIEIGEYALLTKREAKMTRYWPSSFLRFYWWREVDKNAKKNKAN